jgi:hypothetical protein
MKKGYLDISFTTIFAIIAGIFILSLAIYGATKIFGIGEKTSDAEIGKEVGILLNPLEIKYEDGKVNSFSLPSETRIYFGCQEEGIFGSQLIRISQKSFNKWSETDVNNKFKNKYIFAEQPVEGKKFYIFSKPFEFPFKVTDLTYITSSQDKYCFFNAPEDIKTELSTLNQENIHIDNCPKGDIVVCFSSRTGCNIQVNYNAGYLKKGGDTIYFEGDALMYAGIFSDAEIYECQLKRIIKRTNILAQLYNDKANFISRKNCNSNLNEDLLRLINVGNNLESSSGISILSSIAKEIEDKNKIAECRLW